MVSDAWRNLGAEERAKYDEMAREDKARYELEKASYTGPPGGASAKKQRDPNAPKRPMSAFLAFANSRRAEVKAQNPDCSNGEISKILSNMWKEAAEEVTQKYRDEEAEKWKNYKIEMVAYKKTHDGRKKQKSSQTQGNKKKRKKKMKDGDELPSVSDSGFDDHQFSGIAGGHGIDYSGNPNQDEMMAASALRGVRGGPNFPLGPGVGQSMGNAGGIGLDTGAAQQQQLQQGGYGTIFGMNAMAGMAPYGAAVANNGAPPSGGAAGFPQEMGTTTNRALLEMGFPYQQYGSYPLGNSQAMLMAQALRGNPAPYHNQFLGLSGEPRRKDVRSIEFPFS